MRKSRPPPDLGSAIIDQNLTLLAFRVVQLQNKAEMTRLCTSEIINKSPKINLGLSTVVHVGD